jgi:hypothetical protein
MNDCRDSKPQESAAAGFGFQDTAALLGVSANICSSGSGPDKLAPSDHRATSSAHASPASILAGRLLSNPAGSSSHHRRSTGAPERRGECAPLSWQEPQHRRWLPARNRSQDDGAALDGQIEVDRVSNIRRVRDDDHIGVCRWR